MASSAKILCFLLLCFSVSSLHARESQFFSKFSPYNTNTNTNNVKETEIPSKEIEPLKQDEEPTFTPEVHNGYGLYGHNTYSSNNPEKTSTEEYNGGENSEYMFNNGIPHNSNNNNGLGDKQYSLSDTRFQDTGNRNSYNSNNNYGYEPKQTSLNGNNGNYNNYRFPAQQQGMSDTRFLENGKYFYDLNNEDLYRNGYQAARRKSDVFGGSSSRGVNSRNQYNQEGSDENLYKFNNFMEDNQENQEEDLP